MPKKSAFYMIWAYTDFLSVYAQIFVQNQALFVVFGYRQDKYIVDTHDFGDLWV